MKQKFLSIIFNLFSRNKKQIKPKTNTKNIVRNKFGFPQIKDN
jgi:hypothetical protein